jgi:alkaline phosphatase D
MQKTVLILLFLVGSTLFSPATSLFSQQSKLQSGPMVGYVEMREVALWVQTTEAAKVEIHYFDHSNPKTVFKTEEITTTKEQAFVAKPIADQVQPGVSYEYDVYINGKKLSLDYPTTFTARPLWQWRQDPPEFTFALGSCMYVSEEKYDRPGTPYGSQYGIFTKIHEKAPNFMLWLGDNAYLREADWNTRTGIMYRHTHSRSLPELQPLLASTAHYAIWDDHDFGPNNSNRSFAFKHITEEAFNLFWANPLTNATGTGGITSTFQWADCDFFLMDNRYHRSPNEENSADKVMWGKAQLTWLLDNLQSSKAPFKFIATGNQVLHAAHNQDENAAAFPEEKAFLLREIERRGITGVIFLTGDRHHTELTKLVRRGTYPLYDLTVSPLTAGTHSARDEGNYLQVDGTLVNEKNYALMNISGERTNRVLTISIFNNQNELQWEQKIAASELR